MPKRGRTLRRRLEAEGTSYPVLLDEVRLGLAERWLRDGVRPVTSIGFELGYADSANFSRAYGVSPSAYQRGASDPRGADQD